MRPTPGWQCRTCLRRLERALFVPAQAIRDGMVPMLRPMQDDVTKGRGSDGVAAANRLTKWDPACWPVADDWRPVVAQFLAGPHAHRLERFVQGRLAAGATVFPSQPLFSMALTALADVKVVILGQDPYHRPGQAHGLAFSVPPGVKVPPSLRNILAEIERERGAGLSIASATDFPVGVLPSRSGDLTPWARQGVLLLNTCLTVEQGRPGSHSKQGWEALTDKIIDAVSQRLGPVAIMFWGSPAQSRQSVVAATRAGKPTLILTANHPSPLSARRKPKPFIGCGHFGLANEFLRQYGLAPVDW